MFKINNRYKILLYYMDALQTGKRFASNDIFAYVQYYRYVRKQSLRRYLEHLN